MNINIFTYLEFARKTLMPFPGVTEKLCFGTRAFYVDKSLLSRVKEDGETITMQTFERHKWMEMDPITFFITDHYLNYDVMLVKLETVSPDDLAKLLITAWYNRATKKLIKEYEAGGN